MLSAGGVLECSWGALGSFWGASGCLRDASGRPLAAPGPLSGPSWGASGLRQRTFGELLRALEGASPVEKLKMLDLLYLLSENKLFEVPKARK